MNFPSSLVFASLSLMLGAATDSLAAPNGSENEAAESGEDNVTAINCTFEASQSCKGREECCDKEPDCPRGKFIKVIFGFDPSTRLCSFYRWDTGCPSTKNNFSTLDECISKCEGNSTKIQDPSDGGSAQ
uniref:Putative kunitz-type protease inhibitor n=1 Tax=Amblyomma cajennense TaxID=34607 RepID=A0A023FPZ8_AMBCJ